MRRFLLALPLLLQLSLFARGAGTQVPGPGARPNVLWITIEDTSPQFIGAYGNPDVHTPNVDSLINRGVRFTEAFAPAPVCAVARNALITGVSPNKLGTGNHRSAYPIPEWIRGYPAYLRDLGFYTTNNAKTDYNTSRADSIVAASWDDAGNEAGWWDRAPGQPFFSVFNFNESHQSRTMTNPREWYDENVLAELPDSLITRADELTVPPAFRDSPEMRTHVARILNSVNLMDVRVGELLDRLESDGLLDSTIIFFYADHGEAMPGGKATGTGLGYRVPLAMWFPEAYRFISPWPMGSSTDELVVFQDLGPTLISLVGGEVPEYMEGRAILGPARERQPEFVFAGRNRIDETPDLARSVTDGQYVYTRNFMPQYPLQKPQKYADVSDIVQTIRADGLADRLSEGQRRILEDQPDETLYDLHADPWERNNLITDPDQSERLRRMRRAVSGHILAERDLHFLPEAALAELEMPYEFRLDEERYPLADALDAALIVPGSPEQSRRLREALADDRPLVRLWAVIALGRRAPEEETVTALGAALADPHATVAIYAAGALVRYTEDHEAAATLLREYALGGEGYRALTALQQMQYAGEYRPEFLPVFREKLEQMDSETYSATPVDYPLRSLCETSIFLLAEGETLGY